MDGDGGRLGVDGGRWTGTDFEVWWGKDRSQVGPFGKNKRCMGKNWPLEVLNLNLDEHLALQR